ncbi:uncharacterized protein [Diadema antillarum]|uniref:uncharacterized protein n=1 Tax=Diadema antillarum TaxID=105358 RepID=UPI003A8AB3B0
MSGNNNYAVVLNFYEKIDPPPNFPTFVDGWHNLGKYVRKLDYFIATQLHRNVDENGRYKYMNFATFNDTDEMVMKDMSQPSIELLQALGESHGPPGLQTNYPGGYHETKTSEGPVAPDLPAKTESCFLISSFKVTTDLDEVPAEEMLEELVGLELLQESAAASEQYEIGPWALYRRFTPAIPFQPFDLVFRCELQGLGTDTEPATDLIEKLQQAPTLEGVERAHTGLYIVDSENVVEKCTES